MINQPATALGVDYGSKNIGLALVNLEARLPQPYRTLPNNSSLMSEIKNIIKLENVKYIIVGLPRNLDGNKTDQTRQTYSFIEQLKKDISLPVIIKDEALTSLKAEEELANSKKAYDKKDIDALSAVYILEDWLKEDKTAGQ